MLLRRRGVFHPRCQAPVLSATTEASPITEAVPIASAGTLTLPGVEAILAIHRTISAGLEWDGSLLPAACTNYGCTP
jgi:hypothetical protein